MRSPYDKLYRKLSYRGMTYKQYLQSDHWKETRKRYFRSKICKHKCEKCGSTTNLNVHHRTYKRLGKERLMDFVLLCNDCHTRFHKLHKRFYNRNPRKNGLWSFTKKFIHSKSF